MEKCHILFPGAFKPVHAGHVALIEKYLNSDDYDVDVTVVISKSPREGITAQSSEWFLKKVFRNSRKVKIMISEAPSPIGQVYNMIGEKVYGDGIYAMGASSKTGDIDRAEKCVKAFSNNGKYHTEGVEVILFPVSPEPIEYHTRNDAYNNQPISARIVRDDIRKGMYNLFKEAYSPLLKEKRISSDELREYYNKLKEELLPVQEGVLNEGGAAGHMSHPYDVKSFTFADLRDLIRDLFTGEIEHITEKLDGQNLFASVDTQGRTVFARNTTHLKEAPWTLDDIKHNPKWIDNPSVQKAFSDAADTIDAVFKNIPGAVKFFNYDDKADGVRYQHWVNLEIIDTRNFNVIPYAESTISFHGIKSYVYDYSDRLKEPTYELIDLNDDTQREMLEVLEKAIKKTDKTVFKAQVTPEMILKKFVNGELKAEKYYRQLDKIMQSAGVSPSNDDFTIEDYQREMLINYIDNSARLGFLDNDALRFMLDRWTGNSKEAITNLKTKKTSQGPITVEQYSIIRDFDKNDFKLVIKKIMQPLDKLFIQLGNEILKNVQGLANSGHENDIQKSLKKEMKDIEFAVNNSDDEKAKIKLAAALQRLADADYEVNATEGIVFKYKGQLLKLTGSFAPFNQLMGLKPGKFAKQKKINEGLEYIVERKENIFPKRTIYEYIINEEKGITVNTKPTIKYIEDLCFQSIEAAKSGNFNIGPTSFLKIPTISKPGKVSNERKGCTEYFFLYDLPKVQDTLAWLSELTTVMIVCRVYRNSVLMQNNINQYPSMSSIYLTDDNTMKNFMNSSEYNFMKMYIPQVISNYADASYEGTKQSIGHLSINFSFVENNAKNVYCGNLLIDINDISSLDAVIQHELNHMHKSKSIMTSDYLSSYNDMIKDITNKESVISDFVKIAYYAVPNECNAFVEQCYKEYIKEANKLKLGPFEKTYKHVFISEEDRTNLIKKTSTYKKILSAKNNIERYVQLYLSDMNTEQNIQKLKEKVFDDIKEVFNITKRNNETDLKYILRVLDIFSKILSKTMKKCERTISVPESYNTINYGDLFNHGLMQIDF